MKARKNPINKALLAILLSLVWLLLLVQNAQSEIPESLHENDYTRSQYLATLGAASYPFLEQKYRPSNRSDVLANIALGQDLAYERGYTPELWGCLYKLGIEESGWNHLAKNPSSGAFGIPQSLPASKLDTYGDRNDPRVQILWFLDYVAQRYGDACTAYHFQIANDWY